MVDEATDESGSPTRLEPAAWLALALLSVVWAWWAWQEGAYFGVVALPGTILLCAGGGLLIGFAPWRARFGLSAPICIALGAFAALGCWALLSALWSPAADVAVADGQRILMYALSFGLGVGLCNLLGPRINLSLVPVTAAAAFAGVAALIVLTTGDRPFDVLEGDGTLDFPLGYRNAEGAFFGIALFPALGVAQARDLDWRLRAVGVATATLCVNMFLLAQSRASAPAMLVALIVYALLSPLRARALAWLALAVLPAVATFPAASALFHTGEIEVGQTLSEMHHAGAVAAVATVVSLIIGVLAVRQERRLPGLGSRSPKSNRRVAIGLAGLAAIAAASFVVAVGDPVQWFGDRADEFRQAGNPNLSGQASRFSFNAGSDRADAWRVALDDVGDDPVFGDGGGGYQYSYLRKRDVATQNIHDAHSVELELLAELGVVGLLLFVIAIVAVVTGIVRSRRLGPSAAGLSAIALASGSYWLVHTSVDWFWPYPAITAPVLALAGSACAPAVRATAHRPRLLWRGLLIAALAVLAISAVPPWLSERYVNNAYAGWHADIGRAYDDLDDARKLNPLSDSPILAEGAIARAAGDRRRALAAFNEAVAKRPEEWAAHYLLAKLQVGSDPAAAREEIRTALELNPLSDAVLALAKRLGVDPENPGANAGDGG